MKAISWLPHLPAAISLTLGIVLISGCLMIGPDYKTPETEAPDAWHSVVVNDLEQSDVPMHLWWKVFDDPKLNHIIGDLSSNNYSIAAAVAQVEETAARYGIASSRLFPEVGVDGVYQRTRDSERVKSKGSFPDNPYNLYSAGFNASWEIDLWGRVKRGIQSAGANVQASIENYRDLLVVLEADSANTYIEIRTTQQRLLYAKNNLELQNQTLQLTKDRYKAELTSELDVSQAEMNIATTKALIPQLEANLVQRVNTLCLLTGNKPGAYDHLLEDKVSVPEVKSLPSVLPAELLRGRPDIRAAERRLAAQSAMIGVAKGELYPMFSLNGFFDWQASTASDWFDAKSRTYGFGPSFSWSILNFGRVRSSIKVEEARTRQALADYENIVLQAWSESENALISYTKGIERKIILAQAVSAATRSAELVQVQYKNGLTNFQNVLDTQRELFQQQDALALSEGFSASTLVGVYRAFGGGWMPEVVKDSDKDNNGANK